MPFIEPGLSLAHALNAVPPMPPVKGGEAKALTPFQRLSEAVERIDVVAADTIDTARRIAGPLSPRDTEQPAKTDVTCMLDAIEQLASRLHRIATLLDDANSVVAGRL